MLFLLAVKFQAVHQDHVFNHFLSHESVLSVTIYVVAEFCIFVNHFAALQKRCINVILFLPW